MSTEELSSNELEQEFVARRPPFTFAKRHGVLVTTEPGQQPLVAFRPGVSWQTLAELRRFMGQPIRLKEVAEEHFDALLAVAYEHDTGQAMQMMEGLGDDLNLFEVAQQLAEPEDLLESEDDAPIIRLINALLT